MAYHETYQFTHANYWLDTLLKQFPEYNKGQLYLDRFLEACKSLKEKKEIKEYIVWEKDSDMDNSGVDTTIIALDGKSFDFSVTSSYANAQSHIHTNERNPKRGKIRVVYIREGNRPVLKSVENVERDIHRKMRLKF